MQLVLKTKTMKKIELKQLRLINFKGVADQTIEFSKVTRISGANRTGKTTIYDAFTFLLFGKDSAGKQDFSIKPIKNGEV